MADGRDGVLIYRIVLGLAALPALIWLALRPSRPMTRLTALRERLGGGPAMPAGPVLWLHGASNGEMTSARPLLAAIAARWPRAHLAITVNTPAARQMVGSWHRGRLSVTLAPFDGAGCTGRFLRRVGPDALIVIENELWPGRLAECAGRGIPVILASARLSARSARRWQRLAARIGLTQAVLAAITRLFPQDEASAGRFRSLGLAPAAIGPALNLKAVAPPGVSSPGTALPFARSDTILAASTHDGEEALLLDAFRLALESRPGLRLILAPRHPRRRNEIEALLAARKLSSGTRSRGAEPSADAQVYLADTLGEMPLWYAAASVTFVGGSLTDRGGHTPFEPAAFGSAILHGPDVANFADAYAALSSGGAECVTHTAPDIAAAMRRLPGSPGARAMADRARLALAALAPSADLTPLLDEIARALDAPAAARDPAR